MLKSQKKEVVAKLESLFNESGSVMVFHYKGLTVSDLNDLRAEMSKNDVSMQVIKNTLAVVALRNSKKDAKSESLFEGPSAIAWAEDPVAVSKILVSFAKKNENLVLVGGLYGSSVLEAKDVKHLASLPSLDGIRAQLIAMLNAPATKVAQVLQAPAASVATVIDQYSQSN